MESNGISIRYDEAQREFVLALEIKGLRSFEATGSTLSQAIMELGEQLDLEGV